jgi:hypothetical protein
VSRFEDSFSSSKVHVLIHVHIVEKTAHALLVHIHRAVCQLPLLLTTRNRATEFLKKKSSFILRSIW